MELHGQTATTIQVSCLLFGHYAELVGLDGVSLELREGATVADALRQLRQQYPTAASLPPRPLAAVNRAHARPEHRLKDGDELALLPAVSGG